MTKKKQQQEQGLEPVQQNISIPLVSLYAHSRNFRNHPPEQIKQLKASLERWGQVRSIVVTPNDDSSYTIVAGHGIVLAAQELVEDNTSYYERFGHLRADIIPSSWSKEQISGYIVADNLLNNNASDDETLLVQLLQEQADAGYDLASLGTDEESLRQMLESLGDEYIASGESEESSGDGGDDFDTTPSEGPTRTHVGELWQLGEHRLLVGDCTIAKNIECLMQGKKAAITFTSPPYNIAYDSHLPKKDKYLHAEDNLDPDAYFNLLIKFTSIALQYSSYVFVNVQSLSGNKTALIDYLYHFKPYYADTIIWDKTVTEPAMGKNILNSQFEYVHIFSQKATRTVGTKEFRGTVPNIISMSSYQDKQYSQIHHATFPLAFAQHFVNEFSQEDEIILDPFGGTGTTLIAGHRLKRHVFCCEMEPRYADIILRRFEVETGDEPVRVKETVHA